MSSYLRGFLIQRIFWIFLSMPHPKSENLCLSVGVFTIYIQCNYQCGEVQINYLASCLLFVPPFLCSFRSLPLPSFKLLQYYFILISTIVILGIFLSFFIFLVVDMEFLIYIFNTVCLQTILIYFMFSARTL